MTIGEATGLFGLVRGFLLDRPRIKMIATFKDFGPATPGFVTTRVGRSAQIEVYCTGRIPVRITSIGFELTNGQVVELANGNGLPLILRAPEACERWEYAETLAAQIRASGPKAHLRSMRVKVSPDHAMKRKLPRGWRNYPDCDPPATADDPLNHLHG
jgi:hypothetical protein